MKYIIEEKLANAVLNYMISRPYVEVANLIQGLHTMLPYDGPTRDLKTGPVIPPSQSDNAVVSPFIKSLK
jgi:hypothetical protein